MAPKNNWICKLLLAATLVTACSATAFAANWEALDPVNTPRNQFAAGVVDNKIYIYGGNDINGDNLNSTEVLDLDDPFAWSNLADNDHNDGHGVEEVTGASLNGKFYVFGGYGGGNPYGVFNFVQEYDPAGDTWSSKTSMPTKRSAAIAATYNNEIYVFGGDYFHPVTNKVTSYKVVEAYNPTSNNWRKVTNMPSVRQLPAVSVVGDKVYVIGGGLKSTFKAYNTVYAYDFKTNKWKTSGLTPLPTPRVFSFGHAAPVLNGKIYLIGGSTLVKKPIPQLIGSNKVEIYDPVTNTWQIGPVLPQPASFGATVAGNNAVYVISGQITDDDSGTVDNVWKLTDVWKSNLTTLETCDLNADGKFSTIDATLFTNACKNKTAYWRCDLNNDNLFNSKDTVAYKLQWKKATKACSDGILANAFASQLSNFQVEGQGIVISILSDDNNGSRHQRFIIRLSTGQTLLIAHNIDIATRIETLNPGDNLQFNGEYEWNDKGGVIHWTHHDPDGQHANGWIKHAGITYQ